MKFATPALIHTYTSGCCHSIAKNYPPLKPWRPAQSFLMAVYQTLFFLTQYKKQHFGYVRLVSDWVKVYIKCYHPKLSMLAICQEFHKEDGIIIFVLILD